MMRTALRNITVPFFSLSFFLMGPGAVAQQSEGCVFLQGNFLEVGIAPNGSFGTPADAPPDYHSRPGVHTLQNPVTNQSGIVPNALGFVADTGKDGWGDYFGDYFMPGAVQEGFSIEVDDQRSDAWSHAYESPGTGFSGSLTGSNISYNAYTDRVESVWEGNMQDLFIRQTVTVKKDKTYFIGEILLRNTGSTTLKNVYYMRTVDPDNEVTITNNYRTVNEIVYSIPSPQNKILVTAKGMLYPEAYLGLGTKDCRAKPFFVKNSLYPMAPLNKIYSGINSYIYSGTNTADQGIGVVFKAGDILPGESTLLSFAYILNESDLDEAFANINITSPQLTYNGSPVNPGAVIIQPQGTVIPFVITDGTGYTWQWNPSTFLNAVTGTNVNATVSSGPVTYTINGISNGTSQTCGNTGFTVTVSPVPLVSPAPSVSPPAPYCVGQPATALTATGTGSLLWYTAASGGTGNPTAPVPSTGAAGTVTWYVSQILNGIESPRSSITVTVKALPTISITPATPMLYEGESIALSVSGSPASYTWSPVSTLSASTGNKVIASPLVNTTYTVKAVNADNCTASASVLAVIKTRYLLAVPNAFSPNGDHNNDLFRPVITRKLDSYKMIIYNRYGTKLFESNDPETGWDGSFKGKQVNNGVYVYYIKFIEPDHSITELKGTINLIR